MRLTELQNQLFPNQSLQERQLNFSELYLEYGATLIPMLMDSLEPLAKNFTIVSSISLKFNPYKACYLSVNFDGN